MTLQEPRFQNTIDATSCNVQQRIPKAQRLFGQWRRRLAIALRLALSTITVSEAIAILWRSPSKALMVVVNVLRLILATTVSSVKMVSKL